MGNYRQHVAFASSLGCGYAVAAYFLAGLHWLYGSVAALLATLGGLLPDLDSPSGVEMKGFTGILGVLGALAVWQEVGKVHPPPAFELHLWMMVDTFAIIRHGLSRTVSHLAVHRGISHSFPTLGVWTELTYLHYPSESHPVRLMMGAAVGLGFFSHLLLDEICSVDLRGARLNKAFGTAMKMWAPSVWSTLAMYGILSYLTYQAIHQWPDDPLGTKVEFRMPEWPATWPRPSWLGAISAKGSLDPKPRRAPAASPGRSRSIVPRSDDSDGLSDFSTLPLPGVDSRAEPAPRRGGRGR
jgi:hypothetical protein